MKTALVLVVCAGCPSLVVRASRHPHGRVDLDAPPAHESGAPAAYDAPVDPGELRAMVMPGAFAMMGGGRKFDATELGVQLRWTFAESYGESSGRDEFPWVWSAWGAAVGWGFAQLDMSESMSQPAIGGPLYAEANHTWSMLGVGAGVAVYPRDADVGGQLTVWAGPFAVRARVMKDSGTEIYAGYQVELPTVWIWSR